MDKIEKFLRRISKKERAAIAEVIRLVQREEIQNLNIKKLKGYQDIYRVRIGKVRLIYKKIPYDIEVLSISYRNEQTYRDF